MRSRVPARKPRATRQREALADASPEPSFALGVLGHRSNRENVNKLRVWALAGLPPCGAMPHFARAGRCAKPQALRELREGVQWPERTNSRAGWRRFAAQWSTSCSTKARR